MKKQGKNTKKSPSRNRKPPTTTLKSQVVETIDHSLILKVANEIVSMEKNLSRMDPEIRGHKQLTKAIERIKDGYKAYGYEIVDMLGTQYNDGMKAVADFVHDETLAEGERKITGITRPQVNYNGKMVQPAQITVSQNITI